jgi:hypothetical protein
MKKMNGYEDSSRNCIHYTSFLCNLQIEPNKLERLSLENLSSPVQWDTAAYLVHFEVRKKLKCYIDGPWTVFATVLFFVTYK